MSSLECVVLQSECPMFFFAPSVQNDSAILENPCPQMGRVLTVRLSENQDAQTQGDGTVKPVMVETYFQMNYDTGEWKQIRKIRPLREGEGQMA